MAHERNSRKKRARMLPRTAAIAVVLILALTGVSYATGLFGLGSTAVGEYGAVVTASFDSAEVSLDGGVYSVDATPGWLPEGMEEIGLNKYGYTDWSESFSMTPYVLDTGSATFCELVENVAVQEELAIGGHQALYYELENQVLTNFDKLLYIAYPEYNAVIRISITNGIDRETVVQFAEALTVTQTDTLESDEQLSYLTSLYKEAASGRFSLLTDASNASDTGAVRKTGWQRDGSTLYAYAVTAEEINLYSPGESYAVSFVDTDQYVDLDVVVTDVEITDSLSPLSDLDCLDSKVLDALNEDGTLSSNTVQYVLYGDGVNTPSASIVATEEQAQKLVAVTLEITNNSGKDLTNVCYYATLLAVTETEDGYAIYQRQSPNGEAYDDTVNTGVASLSEMCYFTPRSGGVGNGGNYIESLPSGETVTVQIAWVVNADEAASGLFLSMQSPNSAWFTKDRCEEGYVYLTE